MSRQRGFTLLELLVSLAIFTLLGLACVRLFDGVFRVQEQIRQQEHSLRELRRAVAVIERDAWQIVAPASGQPLLLRQGVLNLRRGNWRNPMRLARGERQEVSYVLEQATLWRYSRSLELPGIHKQKLLSDVRSLRWRLYDDQGGWRNEAAGERSARPRALELNLSFGAFEQIRRVILLADGS